MKNCGHLDVPSSNLIFFLIVEQYHCLKLVFLHLYFFLYLYFWDHSLFLLCYVLLFDVILWAIPDFLFFFEVSLWAIPDFLFYMVSFLVGLGYVPALCQESLLP